MLNFKRQEDLPYPQPWEWVRDNINFYDEELFYVDVGANDGLVVSNTAHFDLNLGWKGICVEPHPRAFSELQKNRPNSINLNYCITDSEGEVDFLSISGYAEMLSGIKNFYSEDHLKRIDSEIEKHGGEKQIIKIVSKPLWEVLKEYDVKKIDYLSIDTEGSEFEILNGIDFDQVDIRVISTENSSNKEINKLLQNKGYIFAGFVCGDEIYHKK
jgi:FkbM family methyltransferase